MTHQHRSTSHWNINYQHDGQPLILLIVLKCYVEVFVLFQETITTQLHLCQHRRCSYENLIFNAIDVTSICVVWLGCTFVPFNLISEEKIEILENLAFYVSFLEEGGSFSRMHSRNQPAKYFNELSGSPAYRPYLYH